MSAFAGKQTLANDRFILKADVHVKVKLVSYRPEAAAFQIHYIITFHTESGRSANQSTLTPLIFLNKYGFGPSDSLFC